MSRKILIFISIFSILLILLLALFTISNTTHTTHTSSNELIAEQKAREVFYFRHLPYTLLKYDVGVNEINCTKLFRQHKIYTTVASMGWSPPRALVNVGVGSDGKAFSLPDEFNEVILREQIHIETEEEAFEIAKTYVNCSYPYRMAFADIIILKHFSDIPEGRGKEPSEFAAIIKGPQIKKENNMYFLTFFTWELIGGYLKEWSFTVDENGIADANDKEISRLVGNWGGLE